jgi:AraC-like DNA-binding protein
MYAESAPAEALRRHVACLWTARFGDDGEPHTDRIIPDGCIDMVWTGGRLTVAGPDTGWTPLVGEAGASFAGIRFRPGLAPVILGTPASALVDARVDAAELVGERANRLIERLADAGSPAAAVREIQAAIVAWLPASAPSDRIVEGAVAALRAAPTATPVARLARELGTSERQLNRRCLAAVGYGPKVLHRVLRLRRFLALAAAPGARGLAVLAAEAGFADQAHLTRDCLALTGLSPARLRGRRITGG